MSDVLSLAFRPQSFNKMHGQEKIVDIIRKQLQSKREPKAWMFTGEKGSGKTSIALIMARAFNCTHNKVFGSYCKQCKEIENEIAPSILEIDAARYRTVEALAEIVRLADYGPIPPAKYKVIILDEAHRLSKEAQAILLKPTEKVPKTTRWIICSTDAHKLLETLRRRFYTLAMQPLKHKSAEEFIHWASAKAGIKRKLDDFIEYIHKEGVSSPAVILMMLEKFAAGQDPDKAASDSPLSVNTMRIAKGITAGEWGECRPELERASPEDVRLIRGALLGYFKTELLQHTPRASRKLLVTSIDKIANISYGVEEVGQLALLVARVHELCILYSKG